MDEYRPDLTQVAFMLADLEVHEAWVAYVSYGGNQNSRAVDAYLRGLKTLPVQDSDLLALVLNERLRDLHLPHLANYSD